MMNMIWDFKHTPPHTTPHHPTPHIMLHLFSFVVFASQKLRDFGVAEMTETPIHGRFMSRKAGQLCAFSMQKGVNK